MAQRRASTNTPSSVCPPPDARVSVSGATFARFENDRIVEEHVTWDPRALLTALGIMSVGQDD